MAQTRLDPERPPSLFVESRVESRVHVEATRTRQTQPAPSAFRDVLAGSVSVLMSGAAVATHVLGVPALAAAVQDARVGVGAAVGAGGSPGAPTPGTVALPGGAPATGGAETSDLATMQAMQRESQAFNMQLLALQEEVQQENRRFTTISNVLRAKHDTAKAAVSNIRS